jgi:DNA-binding MarR family transcriptional regulator
MSEPADGQPASPAATLALEIRGIAGKLKRRLLEQGDAGDLPPSQIAVLLRLERDGPATTSALARAEAMRPQSMGAVVAALQASGFVAAAPDPADGRQTRLSLTGECRNWIARARAARQDWLSRTIEARLTAPEQAQLAAALPLLQRLVAE